MEGEESIAGIIRTHPYGYENDNVEENYHEAFVIVDVKGTGGIFARDALYRVRSDAAVLLQLPNLLPRFLSLRPQAGCSDFKIVMPVKNQISFKEDQV